jgi:hypothetical protein
VVQFVVLDGDGAVVRGPDHIDIGSDGSFGKSAEAGEKITSF